MRVCHLVHHLALGGLEKQVLRMIEATDSDAVSYTLCYAGADDSLRDEFEAAGVRVVELEHGSENPMDQFRPAVVRELTGFLRRESFDVLHCHTSLYLHVLGRLCGRLSGTPVIGTYHNTSDNFNRALRVVERISRPLSVLSIAVSKAVERTFARSAQLYEPGRERLDRRTYTIYNGIDVDAFAEAVRDADPSHIVEEAGVGDGPVFLSIGRYSAKKNQVALVEAMGDVVETHPDAHLFVVGKGELEADLRAAVADRDLEEHVTITGRVPSFKEYYAMADVFVLSSITEGLSVVLLEAMASSVPVVATDTAGTAETVVDGETGYIVPIGDRSELVAGMERLAADERRRLFGERGYERARERFSIERTIRSYLDVYERASDRSRSS
jgi:glycosyltransferase involved in cell wall biosynthesis